jgi:DNA-binding response OmpR family regulator
MTAPPSPVHALVDDLFFRAKIEATASAAGLGVDFARDGEELAARIGDDGGTIVLVDLGLATGDPIAAIRALKRRSPASCIVAFGAHRDVEVLARAREAGADQVLARSAFVERLPKLLGAT